MCPLHKLREGSSSPESQIKQKSASAYMDNYNASDIVTDEIPYEDNDQDRFNSNSNGFGATAEDR